MAGYHGALAIHPGSSYGVIVLSSGHYPDAAKLAYDIFEIMQPGFDAALAEFARQQYAGNWVSEDGKSKAAIAIRKGTLYVDELVLDGSNILEKFHSPGPMALRSSERTDEFRCVMAGVSEGMSSLTDGVVQARHRNPVLQWKTPHGLLPVLERAGSVGHAKRRTYQPALFHGLGGAAHPVLPFCERSDDAQIRRWTGSDVMRTVSLA